MHVIWFFVIIKKNIETYTPEKFTKNILFYLKVLLVPDYRMQRIFNQAD